MQVRFLKRETNADAIDPKGIELQGLYLSVICKNHPILWQQFKAVIKRAEEVAAADFDLDEGNV